jgi:NADP-dependent 3-hydroxy acid dehydrogenase YdfG
LKDQAVLVAGASSGIGRATAILFAREGARVLASARRADRLERLAAELAGEGLQIETFAADAGNPDDMQKLADATLAAFGRVDILVYSSGTNTPERWLPRLTVDVWNELIQVNLNGAYYLTRALLPGMRAAQSGHLIYISSISGKTPDVSGSAYQASKRGIIGLAHAIRVEEKLNGIRTCAVCPGLVETEILAKRPVPTPAEQIAVALQPEDVAEMVVSIAKLPPRAAVPELELMPTRL